MEKKGKVKKTKDKVERVKVDKKEKGRRSVEKEVSGEEGVIEAEDATAETEAAPVVTVVKKAAVTKTKQPDLVTKGLTDFQDNFNLISSPGKLPGQVFTLVWLSAHHGLWSSGVAGAFSQ